MYFHRGENFTFDVHERNKIWSYAKASKLYPTKKETHHLELFDSQEDYKW